MIPAGAQVRLCVSAANRDPAQFDQADRLRLDHGNSRHFAFGSGAHACIGAQIGRATVNIAVATLLRRSSALRSIRPLDEIRYFATETALSPESLQVGLWDGQAACAPGCCGLAGAHIVARAVQVVADFGFADMLEHWAQDRGGAGAGKAAATNWRSIDCCAR